MCGEIRDGHGNRRRRRRWFARRTAAESYRRTENQRGDQAAIRRPFSCSLPYRGQSQVSAVHSNGGSLQDIAAEVLILHDIGELLVDVRRIDLDTLLLQIRRFE